MAKFNGHKNWNVSLWINSDEGLYLMARDYVKHNKRQKAAEFMLDALHECNVYKTPDGAPYSVSSIRAAMVNM